MPEPLARYSHSGKVPPIGAVLGVAYGVLLGAPFAAGLAYAQVYIPIVYFNLILAVLFAVGLALATVKFLKSNKVRSTPVGALGAVAALAISFYVCWVFWVFAFFRRADDAEVSLAHLFADPRELWDRITFVSIVGAWRIRDLEPKGGFLQAIWAVEALVVLGIGYFAAHSSMEEDPFCEGCESWCEKLDSPRLGAGAKEDILGALERGDIASLEKLGPPPATLEVGAKYTQFDVHACKGCGETATVKANAVEIVPKKDKKGETDTQLVELVPMVRVSPADLKALIAMAEKVGAAKG